MDFYIVIPAYNEEAHLTHTLQSLVEQSLPPKRIIVVNDGSTDTTQNIIDGFSKKYSFIEGVKHCAQQEDSAELHAPGSKVINAFYKGFAALDDNFNIVCKFDADLIFPPNYLERIAEIYKDDPTIGMAGGFCYIEKEGQWVLENLTNKEHIRGALKSYRKSCFQEIKGLRNTMGWDTVDELQAQYLGWKIKTDETLRVKHLKPTGKAYTQLARFKQGEAFYKMRYGFWLTVIASGKLALRKSNLQYFMDCLNGYWKARNKNLQFIVSEKEGRFIRDLRWKNIFRKFGIR